MHFLSYLRTARPMHCSGCHYSRHRSNHCAPTHAKFTFRGEWLSSLRHVTRFSPVLSSQVLHLHSFLVQEGDSTVSTFEEFYSFHGDEFKKRLSVISMKEFVERECGKNGLAALNNKDYARVLKLANFCENRRKSKLVGAWCFDVWRNCYSCVILHQYRCFLPGEIYCGEIYEKIASHSNASVAPVGTSGRLNTCLVFDEDSFQSGHGRITSEMKNFCGVSQLFIRPEASLSLTLTAHSSQIQSHCIVLYTQELSATSIIHFDSFEKEHRLLTHFYLFIYFTNPVIDNYFKRFVRDFLHYNDRSVEHDFVLILFDIC